MNQTAPLTRKSKESLSRAATRAQDMAGDIAEDLREDAAETVTRVGAAVSATRKAGSALAHDLAGRASETAEYARDLALDRAEAARAAVSDAGLRIAGGLRAAADHVPDGLPSRSLTAVAGGLDSVAASLGGSNLSVMVSRTRDFARRNPATFVIGTAVVGYALVRLLKSSSTMATAPVEAVAQQVEKPVRAVAAKATRAAKPAVRAATKVARATQA